MDPKALLRRSTAIATACSLAVAVGLADGALAGAPMITAGPSTLVATAGETRVAAHPSPSVRTMTDLINRERSSRGLRPYLYDVSLSAVALRWARSLRSHQVLRHNPRLTTQVTRWRQLGENVGYGPSVAATHRAFMRSAPHRANVLNRRFSQVGVAVVKDDHSRYWVVEVFRQP